MSAQPANWMTLHPKIKLLLLGVVVLVLGSVTGALNGTVTWHDTLIADVTGAIALVLVYLKSA